MKRERKAAGKVTIALQTLRAMMSSGGRAGRKENEG